MSRIACNSILEWRDVELNITSVERILWISPDADVVVVIDIGSTMSWPTTHTSTEIESALRDGVAKVLEIDPYARYLNLPAEYVEKHADRRDKAWAVIREIVDDEPAIYDPQRRGPLVRDVCNEFGVHKKVVHDFLRRYWIRGKVANGLMPEYHNSGARGQERISTEGAKRGRPPKVSRVDSNLIGINVTEQDRKRIRSAIKEFYLTPQKPSLPYVYRQMKKNYYNRGIMFVDDKPVPIMADDSEIISFYQFRYWAEKELSKINDALVKRVGQRNYNLTKRPLLGNATQRAFGPGSVFEIDATVADVYCVNSLDRSRIIGRPVVYTLKDVFSRLITGLYVGLEGPSWLGAMMALENAICDKVSFCERYGITIDENDWPCHFLPKTITADRGEMEGTNADNLAMSLGIRIDNAPPYRADLKGIIEKNFDIYKGKIGPFIPGYVERELRERGEADYRLRARMSVDAFTRIIIYSVLEHNKEELNEYPLSLDMTRDHVPPIPIELWNWGIVNCSGQLSERPRDLVRLNLMPRVDASVTRNGIVVNHREFGALRYACDEVLRQGWFERATKGRFRVQVAFDFRNASAIYIPNRDGTDYLTCDLLSKDERFRDARVEEVMDQYFYEDVASKRRKTDQNQNQASYASLREQVMEEEVKLTEASLDPEQSAASRTKDIRAARRDERERIREQEAWALGDSSSKVGSVDNPVPEVDPQNNQLREDEEELMDMIVRQARERRQ